MALQADSPHSEHSYQPSSGTHYLYSTTGSIFEIGRTLGNGGMGRVYLAQRRSDLIPHMPPQLVALKILHTDSPLQARRLFYHEGSLLPRLQHPHIVRCIERGRGALAGVGTLDYLALDYIAGETAEHLLRRVRGPLPTSTVLGIVAQITSALDYLHQRGVVHCDIKPNNIMLEHGAPRAVLIDFGVARAPDLAGWPVAVGTPQYMAPEQIDPRHVCDGRADLYALGVLIYELISGRRLFPYRTTTDIQQGSQITLDSHAVVGIPGEAIANVIERCLQPDLSLRYPTADELLSDLQRACRSHMND